MFAGCLATLLMRISRMLVGSTRVFMRLCGMLLGGGVITFVMVFSSSMMGFSSSFVGFGCFFVVGTGHVSFL
jgi:hypothetical protein